MSSILSLPITKVSSLLRNKSISPKELLQLCLNRINETKDLNAFITVTEKESLLQAEQSEERICQGESLGLLDGIPIALKDNWSTKDISTTCASKMLSNYVAPYNGTIVQKLYDKGVAMVGKTNLDEFAMGSATVDSFYGPTKNPWKYNCKVKKKSSDDSLKNGDFYVAGGSSGGSAVAVASGMCFGAIGSDTGGSTRSPAAMCGIVGLKPTYGLVSRNGLIPLCNSLDVPGILARSVDDAALILNSIAGPDVHDSTTVKKEFATFTIPEDVDVRNLHVGIPTEYQCSGMSSEVISSWRKLADKFADAGARITNVSLPNTKYSIVCYSVLCCCDVASNFARYDGIRYGHRTPEVKSRAEHPYGVTRREGFGEVVRERILAGNYFLLRQNYEKYFVKAAQVRRLICDDFKRVFEGGVDLLLTPVTLNQAVPYSEWTKMDNRQHNAVDDYCTQAVNMAGLPAVSVPCNLSQKHLPLSLQLIGRPFAEKQLLTAAKWIEQQVCFPHLQMDSP